MGSAFAEPFEETRKKLQGLGNYLAGTQDAAAVRRAIPVDEQPAVVLIPVDARNITISIPRTRTKSYISNIQMFLSLPEIL